MPGTKYKQIANLPIKKPKNVSDAQWAIAVDLYQKSKEVGDKYPELTVAQAALETGWFKSLAGEYNYFGQKAGKGQQSVSLKTKEQGDKGLYSTTANFRSYNSLEESLKDRHRKWGTKYNNAKNAQEALDIVVKNGYATAKNYKSSVGSILNSITNSDNKTIDLQSGSELAVEDTSQYLSPTIIATTITPELRTDPAQVQSSTTEYIEPQIAETQEVQQAKQEINEKSFLEELGSIFSQTQQQEAPQPQQDIAIDPSAYNYINIDSY